MEALQVAQDLDLKFDLALQLDQLNIAYDIVKSASPDLPDTKHKWKQLADLALNACQVKSSNLSNAFECFQPVVYNTYH